MYEAERRKNPKWRHPMHIMLKKVKIRKERICFLATPKRSAAEEVRAALVDKYANVHVNAS